MRDLDQFNITDEVLKSLAKTQDPRLKQITASLVRHLHAFAREVSLTPEEWIEGIKFLTAVGQACTPVRQEFILLSDTLGLSALVNAVNNQAMAGATKSSLLGPFFRENAPEFPAGGNIAANDPGEVIALLGRVRDTAGKPIPHARIDVWQTSTSGLYDVQMADPEKMDLRGHFTADAEGRYFIRSVIPLGYSIPTDGPVANMVRTWNRHLFRPAHIHFLLGAEGYRELATALYLGRDKNIDSDVVYGVSDSLVVDVKPAAKDGPAKGLRHIVYDFALSPASAGERSRRVGADPAAVMPAGE